MKKILSFIGFLLFTNISVAAPASPLYISIKNDGATDCSLKSQLVLWGELAESTPIPEFIMNGETVSFTLNRQSHCNQRAAQCYSKGVLLNYECGVDKDVTLFVEQRLNNVWGRAFNSHNIQAQLTSKPSKTDFFGNVTAGGKIDWTLTH